MKNLVNLPVPRRNIVARATEMICMTWEIRDILARMSDLRAGFSDFTLWKAQLNASCHIFIKLLIPETFVCASRDVLSVFPHKNDICCFSTFCSHTLWLNAKPELHWKIVLSFEYPWLHWLLGAFLWKGKRKEAQGSTWTSDY